MKAQGDVSAISGGRDRLAGELYAALERQAAALLQGEMESAIRQAVKRDRCDIFGFGNLLYQRFPDQWRQASGDWPTLMAQASYQVEVSAKVLRLEQEVAGAPQDRKCSHSPLPPPSAAPSRLWGRQVLAPPLGELAR